jgi:hypothetical protein
MKIVKGWRKISNAGGFLNEYTGQTLAIVKKEFGMHYRVLLFAQERTEDANGKKISPDFETEVKAAAFGLSWMEKNPNGTLDLCH